MPDPNEMTDETLGQRAIRNAEERLKQQEQARTDAAYQQATSQSGLTREQEHLRARILTAVDLRDIERELGAQQMQLDRVEQAVAYAGREELRVRAAVGALQAGATVFAALAHEDRVAYDLGGPSAQLRAFMREVLSDLGLGPVFAVPPLPALETVDPGCTCPRLPEPPSDDCPVHGETVGPRVVVEASPEWIAVCAGAKWYRYPGQLRLRDGSWRADVEHWCSAVHNTKPEAIEAARAGIERMAESWTAAGFVLPAPSGAVLDFAIMVEVL